MIDSIGTLSVILNFVTIESVTDDKAGFCLASPSGKTVGE